MYIHYFIRSRLRRPFSYKHGELVCNGWNVSRNAREEHKRAPNLLILLTHAAWGTRSVLIMPASLSCALIPTGNSVARGQAAPEDEGLPADRVGGSAGGVPGPEGRPFHSAPQHTSRRLPSTHLGVAHALRQPPHSLHLTPHTPVRPLHPYSHPSLP